MKTFLNSSELEYQPTAHGAGLKKILIHGADSPTMLTQFAYGKLFAGEEISEHAHNSMEEIFYFLNGNGIYMVDRIEYMVSSSTVVRIPAGMLHSLKASGETALEFLYFGIATT